MPSLSSPEVSSRGDGDGEACLRQRLRRGGRLAGDRHPDLNAGVSGKPRTRVPSSSPTSTSVPLRRSCVLRACRRQEHNRARQWDCPERDGKAALVIGTWPCCGYTGPDFPCFRLLHVISNVVRWCVAGVHGALSRLFERDSLAGWSGKYSHLNPISLPLNQIECTFSATRVGWEGILVLKMLHSITFSGGAGHYSSKASTGAERLFEKSSIGGISAVHSGDECPSIPHRPY